MNGVLYILLQLPCSLVRSEAHDHQDMGLCDQFLPTRFYWGFPSEKHRNKGSLSYHPLDIQHNVCNSCICIQGTFTRPPLLLLRPDYN